MLISKSFGYALRGILYIALNEEKSSTIQADELAEQLTIPKYFMAKILKSLAQHKIIRSIKGPNGGFSLTSETLELKLIDILKVTDSKEPFEKCILQWKRCNSDKPCPMHHLITSAKKELIAVMTNTSIADLIKDKSALRQQLLGNLEPVFKIADSGA